jgi:hypothetical protein
VQSIVFEQNAKFFAENWRKSPKVLIITLPPLTSIFYERDSALLAKRAKRPGYNPGM